MARRIAAFALVGTITLVAGLFCCQADQCANVQKSPTNPQGQLSSPLPNGSSGCPDEQSGQKEPPHWYASPEWWLVIIAVPTLVFVWFQARETARAARAAQGNIDLVISKERARVEIIAGSVPNVVNTLLSVTCHLKNSGPTMAFIEGGAVILRQGPKDVDADYSKCTALPYTGNIPSTSNTPGYFLIPLEPKNILTQSDITALQQGQSFIHFYGFVRYRDVFDRFWRVRIHLRWTMVFGGVMPGQVTEYWEIVGRPEENSDKAEPEPN